MKRTATPVLLSAIVAATLQFAAAPVIAGPLGGAQPLAGAQATALTLTPGSVSTTYRRKIKFTAGLSAESTALSGKRIDLYEGSDATGWAMVKSATTDRKGHAKLEFAATTSGSFVAAYSPVGDDAPLYAAAESGAAAVEVRPKLSLSFGSSGAAIVPGQTLKVRGKITPYVAGERIQIRVSRRSRNVEDREIAVGKFGNAGVFTFKYKPSTKATYRISVTHLGSELLAGGPTRSRRFTVAIPSLHRGSRGKLVKVLQRMLRHAGYVTPINGVYGLTTGIAVRAMRKVSGMGDSPDAGRKVWRRLAKGGGKFKLRYPNSGHHVEFDWSRQVLALASGGKVQRVYPTSSGKPSTPTPFGTYHFYTQTPGFNAKGMYYSTFFIAGYAVHGYADVPSYPASHGCIRVPIASAIGIYSWLHLGDTIFLYR